MTTEPAKGSHDRFIDRTISPPINNIAQTDSTRRLRDQSSIADTAKGTPSNKIRPGMFAKAEISGLRFGYAPPGGPSAPVPRAPSPSGSKDPAAQVVEDIFAEAKSQPDQALALQVLGQRYETAPEAVREKLLADHRAKNIVATVANDVNKVFAAEPKNPIRAAGLAIRSVVKIITTYDLKPTIAGALLDETFKGHVQAFSAVQNGTSDPAAPPEFAREGQELMAQLLAFTAKTPQGKRAAASLTAFSENETKRLVSALRASLPSIAKTGFEQLVKISTNLEPQTRFALLSQIDNYRNDKRIDQVIKNLELLCGGPQSGRRSPLAELFRKSLLFDQQRFAKVIACVAQYDGDRMILDNTLKVILDPNSNIEIKWVNLGRDFGVRQRNLIALNRDYIEPGNGKLAGDNALHVAVNSPAHEVNHIKNRSPADGSSRHAEHEYVSWCVGFKARHKRWPNQLEAYSNCLRQLIRNQGIYKKITETFRSNSDESRKIAVFIGERIGAKLLGKNPSEATVEDIVRFDQTFVQMFNDNRNFLSTTEYALIPQAIDGVPLNLDNHP